MALQLATKGRRGRAVAVWLILAASSVPQAASADSPNDILIVCNSSVPVESADLATVRELFLLQRPFWNADRKVIPIDAPDESELRKDFRARVLGWTAEQEALYWQKRKIKQGDLPPTTFPGRLKAVYKLRNAVSYVYRSEYREDLVKVLLVVGASRNGGAK